MRRLTCLALVLLCALMACAQSTYPYPPDPSNPQSEMNPLYVTTPPTVDFHMDGTNHYVVRTCTANCAIYLPSCVGKVGQVYTIFNGSPVVAPGPAYFSTDPNANGIQIALNPYPGETLAITCGPLGCYLEPGESLKFRAQATASGCFFTTT